jgi:hypothetical protein
MWQLKTHRQRGLVIHRVDGRDPETHDYDDDTGHDCPCGPEVLAPEGN